MRNPTLTRLLDAIFPGSNPRNHSANSCAAHHPRHQSSSTTATPLRAGRKRATERQQEKARRAGNSQPRPRVDPVSWAYGALGCPRRNGGGSTTRSCLIRTRKPQTKDDQNRSSGHNGNDETKDETNNEEHWENAVVPVSFFDRDTITEDHDIDDAGLDRTLHGSITNIGSTYNSPCRGRNSPSRIGGISVSRDRVPAFSATSGRWRRDATTSGRWRRHGTTSGRRRRRHGATS